MMPLTFTLATDPLPCPSKPRVRSVERVAVLAVRNRHAVPPAPSLSKHVLRVVLGCAEKQMGRIHACAVIASVADQHTIGNRAFRSNPSRPMCQDFVVASRPRQLAVPVGHGESRPAPTPGLPVVFGIGGKTIIERTATPWTIPYPFRHRRNLTAFPSKREAA